LRERDRGQRGARGTPLSNALAAERGVRHCRLDFLMVDRVGRAHRHGDGKTACASESPAMNRGAAGADLPP
jgi:hypothetical protein